MSLPPYDQTIRDFERHFQVVLPDGVGQATVGFRDGVWYRLNSGAPHPVPIRSAIILVPHAAGSIVQIACWWMRENTRSPRALDLATELALTVGELARKAIEDDPLGMSLNTLSTSSAGAISPLSSSNQLGASALGSSSSFAGAGIGSMAGTSGYDSGSYSTDPYAPAQPAAPSYEPVYAAAPPVAATTLIPQITPDMTAPSSGRPLGVPRPAGPPPGLTPLPPAAGRPAPAGPAGPGYGMPRGPMPGGRPPMGPGGPGMGGPAQTGGWDRPGAPDPRSGRPMGGPQQRQGGYDGSEPRDDFFRSGPPQQRRQDDYGRPPSRPVRPEAGRSW
jgi:hypothetical protein